MEARLAQIQERLAQLEVQREEAEERKARAEEARAKVGPGAGRLAMCSRALCWRAGGRSVGWRWMVAEGAREGAGQAACAARARQNHEGLHSCFSARAGSNHIGNFLFSVISGFSVFRHMELVDMTIWKF